MRSGPRLGLWKIRCLLQERYRSRSSRMRTLGTNTAWPPFSAEELRPVDRGLRARGKVHDPLFDRTGGVGVGTKTTSAAISGSRSGLAHHLPPFKQVRSRGAA